MVDHDLVALLRDVEACGLTLDLEGHALRVAGPRDAAHPVLLDRLRSARDDLVVLLTVALEHDVLLSWCAEQLAPDDHPAQLGLPCVRTFITLCIKRDGIIAARGGGDPTCPSCAGRRGGCKWCTA